LDLNHKDILESRDKLAKRLAEVEARLSALQLLSQERDILKQTIWGLEELLKKYEGLPLTGYPDHPPLPDSPLWEGARYVLRQAGSPLSAGEISERLRMLGWKMKGKTPTESVRTILLRKPAFFERVEGAKFRLKQRD
jgi:hypothetical protein